MRDLPGGPVARTQRFHCWGLGLIPVWGTKILEAVRPAKKKKKKAQWDAIQTTTRET